MRMVKPVEDADIKYLRYPRWQKDFLYEAVCVVQNYDAGGVAFSRTVKRVFAASVPPSGLSQVDSVVRNRHAPDKPVGLVLHHSRFINDLFVRR